METTKGVTDHISYSFFDSLLCDLGVELRYGIVATYVVV